MWFGDPPVANARDRAENCPYNGGIAIYASRYSSRHRPDLAMTSGVSRSFGEAAKRWGLVPKMLPHRLWSGSSFHRDCGRADFRYAEQYDRWPILPERRKDCRPIHQRMDRSRVVRPHNASRHVVSAAVHRPTMLLLYVNPSMTRFAAPRPLWSRLFLDRHTDQGTRSRHPMQPQQPYWQRYRHRPLCISVRRLGCNSHLRQTPASMCP